MSYEFPHQLTADQVTQMLADDTTAVINVVAAWCPDCTEAQAANIDALRTPLVEAGVMFGNLLVQEEKKVFLSPLHEVITEGFGGHGYPRTVLISGGKVLDRDNVEVTEATELAQLAQQMLTQIDAL